MAIALLGATRPAIATDYRWVGGSAGAWDNAASWSPPRVSPAASDQLSFDSGDSIAVTGLATTTVTALRLLNHTRVHLSATATATLNIGIASAGLLLVTPGSTLALGYNAPPSIAIDVKLAKGATALIQGAIRTGRSAGQSTLDAVDSLAITFVSGSTLELTGGQDLFPLSGTDSVAVFESGSRFLSHSGNSPFRLIAPRTKLLFRHGSLFWMTQGNGGIFDVGARRYGDVRIDGGMSLSTTGNGGFELDSLFLKESRLTLSVAIPCKLNGTLRFGPSGQLRIDPTTSWAEFHLSHDIIIDGNGGLLECGAQIRKLVLDGTSQQAWSGSLLLSGDTLVIANANDIRLAADAKLQSRGLQFVAGRVLANAGALTLLGVTVLNPGPSTGWVVGRLIREAGLTDSLTFEVGDLASYTPVTLAFTGVAGFPLISVFTLAQDHPNIGSSPVYPNQKVHRRWFIEGGANGSFTSYRARFTWVPTDADAGFNPNLSHVLEWNGATWSTPQMLARAPTSAEATGITELGQFAVGDAPGNSYRWLPSTGAWTNANNWSPARTVPSSDDRLVFDRGGTVITQAVPTQIIGQLVVSNATALQPRASARQTLTMIGGAGPGLQVGAGCSIGTETSGNAIDLRLATGTSGSIFGTLTIGGAPSTLDAADAAAIAFESGSTFVQSSTNAAFTTTGPAGTIVFKDGSTFKVAGAIGSPFGLKEPASKVLFQPASKFLVNVSCTLDLSGRTYGIFMITKAENFTPATLKSAPHFGGIQVKAGSLTLALNADAHVSGDVLVEKSASLMVTSFGAKRLILDGTQNQTLTLIGTLGFSSGAGLSLANSAGATLASKLSMGTGVLDLASGPLRTANQNVEIGINASLTRTSGWVAGNLQRRILPSQTRVFDIGSETQYLPVTIQLNNLVSSFDLTAVTLSSDHPNLASSCLDPSRSVNRYWKLTPVGTTPLFTSAALTFSYGGSDLDPGTFTANLKAQRYSGAAWSTASGVVSGTNSTTLLGFTAFGSFAVGNPSHVALQFVNQPIGPTVVVGGSADLSGVVIGDGPISYQWRHWGAPVFDGGPFSGAHTAQLHVSFAGHNEAGDYDLIATGPCSEETSRRATLTLTCDGPRGITGQPIDATVPVGGPVSFHADVQPCHTAVYRWYKDGVLLPFEAGDTYSIASVTPADAGVYQLIVSDALGSMASRKAALNLVAPVLLSYSLGTPTPTSAHGVITFAAPVTGALDQGNTTLLGITQPLVAGSSTLAFDVTQIGAPQTYFRVRAQSPDNHELLFGSPLDGDHVAPVPGVVVFPSGRPVFAVSATKQGQQPWSYAAPTLGIMLQVEDVFGLPAWSSTYVVTVEDMRLGSAAVRSGADPSQLMSMPFPISVPSNVPYVFQTSETGAVVNAKLWLNIRLRWYESSAPDAKSYPLQYAIPFQDVTP